MRIARNDCVIAFDEHVWGLHAIVQPRGSRERIIDEAKDGNANVFEHGHESFRVSTRTPEPGAIDTFVSEVREPAKRGAWIGDGLVAVVKE